MRSPVLLVPLLLILAAAAPVEGQLNRPFGYEEPALDVYGDGTSRLVLSGSMEASLPGASGGFGFLDSTGRLTAITQVCTDLEAAEPDCHEDPDGGYSLHVAPGSSFGLRFPSPVDVQADAAHILGFFTDLSASFNGTRTDLGRSLVASTVDAQVRFLDIPAIPEQEENEADAEAAGALVLLTAGSAVEIRHGGQTLQRVQGNQEAVLFTGPVRVDPVRPAALVLPMQSPDAVLDFAAAAPDAASQGMDLGRLNQVLATLHDAGGETEEVGLPEAFLEVIPEILNGALLRLPTEEAGQEAFHDVLVLVRFASLQATFGGEQMQFTGQARLHVQDGNVQNAPALHGFGYVLMPWWGWILWLAAAAALTARLVLKPPTEHTRWDRYRWIGPAAWFVALALVFFLWDLEMRAVMGSSILATGATGAGFWFTAGVQLALLGCILLVIAVPIKLLLTNASILARQGTFMGLSGAAGTLLAYLLGARLLSAYLGVFLERVIGAGA